MNRYRSKILWSTCFLFLFSSFGLSAHTSWNRPNIQEISKNESSVEERMNQITEKKISGDEGVIHPPSIRYKSSESIFFNTSFLYWQTSNHGFRFAVETRMPYSTGSGENYYNNYFCEVDYDWHPGARADIGYHSSYDCWDAWATWTWMRSSNSASYTAKDFMGGANRLGFISTYFSGLFQYSSGHWRLNYNTADLQIARSFFLSKALSFRPLLGMRAGMLYQSYKVNMWNTPLTAINRGSACPLESILKAHSSYWGVGPRLGCEARLDFMKYFAANINASGALLYGKRDAEHAVFRNIFAKSFFTGLEGRERDTFRETALVPTVAFSLGLDWGKSFLKDHLFVGLSAAWEFNYWWDQYHFTTLQETYYEQLDEAIEMQGMTFSLYLAF